VEKGLGRPLVARAIGIGILSHLVLDVLTHARDIVLWPGSTLPALGLGLYDRAPMWGFAMLWLALAAAVTIRTARQGLPFSLTWWSFTFPVGTELTRSFRNERVPLVRDANAMILQGRHLQPLLLDHLSVGWKPPLEETCA
jgi:hypothetical protein